MVNTKCVIIIYRSSGRNLIDSFGVMVINTKFTAEYSKYIHFLLCPKCVCFF